MYELQMDVQWDWIDNTHLTTPPDLAVGSLSYQLPDLPSLQGIWVPTELELLFVQMMNLINHDSVLGTCRNINSFIRILPRVVILDICTNISSFFSVISTYSFTSSTQVLLSCSLTSNPSDNRSYILVPTTQPRSCDPQTSRYTPP